MAGQYEQALQIHHRLPKEMFADADYIESAEILEAAGRSDEAEATVAEALAAHPSITIESWTGDPGWSDEDRRSTIALMRKAGFPACATKAEVAKGGIKVRLPDCLQVNPAATSPEKEP